MNIHKNIIDFNHFNFNVIYKDFIKRKKLIYKP